MVRIVGLTLTGLLVIFQLWYTNAPAHQRAYVPGWVQSGANVGARGLLAVADSIGDAVGPTAKRGWEETRMQLGLMARPEAPREGMLAVNEDLSGQSFATERLGEATFLGATLTGTDFTKAYLVRSMMDGASAEAAIFNGAIMETVSMRTARMAGSSFVGADLTAVQAQGADLSATNLSGATLSRAQLSAANLTGASFAGANLSRAVMFKTNLAGADLSGAVGLQQQQLDEACGDAATLLPPALSVPVCAERVNSLR